MSELAASPLYVIRRITGKYLDIEILGVKGSDKRFIRGVIKCPFTGKEFKFDVTPHTDQVKLGFVQHESGFSTHILNVKEYSEWIIKRIEPYSRNSFHKRRVFACRKCDFKTTNFIEMLIHLITIHNFLVSKP